ncbi:hypothetical protein [Amycolatopsis tucumanensis]|uniref:Uncharacterized protein n=1 Tax=Amycolatopsis tucumanensis TaxID=401106 RepID=A0ABP7JX60_9PSEU|nr:hypothetical protein [Amycolatopsis tucumanensis]MCF6428484.1 hypothetical protein [Amycolatopsis tucumanensis]
MASLPRPHPTRRTGYALIVLGAAVALANWLVEQTGLRHFPDGHSPLYVLVGLIVAGIGLRVISLTGEE